MNDTTSNSINCATFQPHNYIPTDKDVLNYSSRDMTGTEKSMTLPFTISKSNTIKENEKVLFIKYTTESNMETRWYLVQLDIESTFKIEPFFTDNGKYH